MLTELLYLVFLLSTPASLKAMGSLPVPLATHEISLNERYGNAFVNDVFKDNILLTLNYLDGAIESPKDISWSEVKKPFRYEFTLKPGEGFAFHDKLLPEYSGRVVKTTNAHFNFQDGFKSDGYLTGDGVCHLASLIYWVAKEAGLTAVAPANHDFANIPGVPREYGVSIYVRPDDPTGSALQNLYITNNRENPIRFVFDYKNSVLSVGIFEAS
ncbi:VanW family protein [Patescibacteria group bacterium]|nr:VanW family protein [Patescibacteria group bacterium]